MYGNVYGEASHVTGWRPFWEGASASEVSSQQSCCAASLSRQCAPAIGALHASVWLSCLTKKENRLSESSNRLHKLMHQAKLLHNDVPLREPLLEVYSWPAIQDLRLALYGQNSIIFLPIYVVIDEAS